VPIASHYGKFFNNPLSYNDYELSRSQWEAISTKIEKIKRDMPTDIR